MKWQPLEQPLRAGLRNTSVSVNTVPVLPGIELLSSLKILVENVRAGEVLQIMSPVIDHSQVVSWLRAARQRGVVVRILTTLVDRHGIHTKGWDASENIEKHDESIRELAKCGCILRSTRTTPHGKFVLGGGGKLWFGSANLTIGALGGRSVEAGFVLDDDGMSSQVRSIFDHYWKLAPFRMIHRQGAILIEEKRCHSTVLPDEELSEHEVKVWSSAPGVSAATYGINRLLDSATDEILLVAMSLYQLDQVPGMQSILLSALQRGVRVRAVVRKEHFTDEEMKGQYPDPATRNLLKSGMELLGVKGLHAKGFLVDDRWCGIQSANFNPYSFDWRRSECNVELILVGVSSNPLLSSYAGMLRHLCSTATHRMG